MTRKLCDQEYDAFVGGCASRAKMAMHMKNNLNKAICGATSNWQIFGVKLWSNVTCKKCLKKKEKLTSCEESK